MAYHFIAGEDDDESINVPNPDPHPNPPLGDPDDSKRRKAPGKGDKTPHKAPGEGLPHPMGDPRQRKI